MARLLILDVLLLRNKTRQKKFSSINMLSFILVLCPCSIFSVSSLSSLSSPSLIFFPFFLSFFSYRRRHPGNHGPHDVIRPLVSVLVHQVENVIGSEFSRGMGSLSIHI